MLKINKITPTPLEVSVRPYAEVQDEKRFWKKGKEKIDKPEAEVATVKPYEPWVEPEHFIVFDTETRIDHTQRLMFGFYQHYQNRECMEEGLFYADDLTPEEMEIITRYAANHKPDVCKGGNPTLQLLPKREFNNTKLYRVAWTLQGLV